MVKDKWIKTGYFAPGKKKKSNNQSLKTYPWIIKKQIKKIAISFHECLHSPLMNRHIPN